MEWYLDEETSVTDGPVSKITVGDNIEWDIHSKQGVFFFPQQFLLDNYALEEKGEICCEVVFNSQEGDIKFSFK